MITEPSEAKKVTSSEYKSEAVEEKGPIQSNEDTQAFRVHSGWNQICFRVWSEK